MDRDTVGERCKQGTSEVVFTGLLHQVLDRRCGAAASGTSTHRGLSDTRRTSQVGSRGRPKQFEADASVARTGKKVA